MAVTYYAILTAVGAAKLANAAALGTTLQITQMAVGDGGGNVPVPDANRTTLVNEVRRAPLNQLKIDPSNAAQIIAEQVIPESVGGWWIREMGLLDNTGALIAIANCAPSYKPQLAEGSGRTQTVRMVLIVNNTGSVELKIDPSVVLATREYCDNAIATAINRQDAKASVRAATTANIALNGLPTIDGVVLAAGDRVLVKNQAAGSQNGIYIAAAGAWVRSADADENAEVTPSLTVSVECGTTQADTVWQLITDAPIVVGATALVFKDITNGLARLASPAFTGTPTAPTAAPGTNTQQLATAAFVQAAIAPLAPLASPIFTGDPKAPTPSQFDNDTSIATTAFVKTLGIHANAFASYSANGNIPASDAGRVIQLASAVACTYTLPVANTVPNGAVLFFKNTGSALATVQRAGTDAIAAGNNTVNSMALGSGDDLLLVSNGNNAWFAYSGSAQLQYSAVFSALLNNPGWRKLPSGEIEQFGTLGLTAVGNYNTQTIGGTTFYTHYYQIAYPIAFTTAVYEAEATIACATLAAQTSMAGKGASLNLSGTGHPLTGMAIAITTPNLGEVPTVHWRSRGK